MRLAIHTLAIILILVGLTGCPTNPASMGKAEVEKLLTDNLALKSVTIAAKPQGGGFTGTGQGTDGVEYKIDVIQDAAQKKLSYTAESKNGEEVKSGHIMHK
ncbi:MAG: hypothetical protein JWN70_5551 [Planctomycetaceae bacterium]|nr:hypothetical protein [Planctomycetaceae bacterium]